MRRYELKTDTGKVVEWSGVDGEDAARRAADALRVTVVAHRPADRHGLHVGLLPIVGPDGQPA